MHGSRQRAGARRTGRAAAERPSGRAGRFALKYWTFGRMLVSTTAAMSAMAETTAGALYPSGMELPIPSNERNPGTRLRKVARTQIPMTTMREK